MKYGLLVLCMVIIAVISIGCNSVIKDYGKQIVTDISSSRIMFGNQVVLTEGRAIAILDSGGKDIDAATIGKCYHITFEGNGIGAWYILRECK